MGVAGIDRDLRHAGVVCALCMAWVSTAGSTGQDASRTPTLRVRSDLVVLHVSVAQGREPVADLPCEAFRVYENDRPQAVTICERGGEALALGLAVDSSTSMGRYRELLASAGQHFVQLGNPANDVFVLQFNERVYPAPPARAFTHRPEDVARAVRGMGARGMTALHDAIIEAIAWAEQSRYRKRAVVLVSDGGDNASTASFERALAAALSADVTFFAVGLSDPLNRDADPDKLRRLARETGGLVFTPDDPSDLDDVFERIARDLQSGYTLAFVSDQEHRPGEYRAIRVVAGRAGRTLRVRTRTGYATAGGADAVAR